jgi:raffinose/stachyose/melibiose transport system substrate-binding protein
MRRNAVVAAFAAAALLLAGCGSSAGGQSASAKQELVLWHNYGTEQNATATQNLVKAFEKANPNITIKVVSQPADNYFSLLQASAVSHTGPDLAVMWTGLFTLQYKKFLVNLKDQLSSGDLGRMQGLQWTADNFDAKNGSYVMPLEKQFYIGFYSKKAFQKAGVSTVPTTWDELFAACSKLKSAGYTPIVYGNGGQALGAEFYPWYDMSYLMIGAYPLDQWRGLYDGSIPWTDPRTKAQLDKWQKLQTSGCTNSDVLTKTDNLGDFEKGKAAMIIDGTWDTQKFTDSMGSDVAPFVPPFSDSAIKGVVEYPGDGFAMTSYSDHKPAAAKFLQFLTTTQAADVVNAAGLIPDIQGTNTTNPVNEQMLKFALDQGYTRYPMLDNVVQPDVVDTGNKVIPPVLGGKSSPDSALPELQKTWQGLPSDQRGSSYK